MQVNALVQSGTISDRSERFVLSFARFAQQQTRRMLEIEIAQNRQRSCFQFMIAAVFQKRLFQ